jgi:hypothetical protein
MSITLITFTVTEYTVTHYTVCLIKSRTIVNIAVRHSCYRMYVIFPRTSATSHWLQPPHSKITSICLSLLNSITKNCEKEKTYSIAYGFWLMGHSVDRILSSHDSNPSSSPRMYHAVATQQDAVQFQAPHHIQVREREKQQIHHGLLRERWKRD